jgi:predicted TPR repeat methyltransferase
MCAQQVIEPPQVLATYQKLLTSIEEKPDNIDLLHQAIILSLKLKRDKEAARLLNQSCKLDPSHPENTLLNALYHQSIGKISHAIKILTDQLNNSPRDNKAQLLLANLLHHQGEYEKAINFYHPLIKAMPEATDIHYQCALAHSQNKNYSSAKEQLTHIINKHPTHHHSLNLLGQIALHKEEYRDACDHFSKALYIKPDQPEIWHSLAQAEFQRQKYKEAIDSFSQCIHYNPQHNDAHHELANTYIRIRKFDDAIRHYHRQIEIEPMGETYFNLAVCYMYQEKTSDAKHFFEQTIKQDPNHTASYLNLGSLFLKNNQLKKAITAYQKALSLKPNDPEIKHILSAIQKQKPSAKAPQQFINALFNQYANYYDQHLIQHLQYQVHQLLYDFLDQEQWPEKSMSILDLGCGTGLCGNLFTGYANTLIGIDSARNMIEHARNKNIYTELICKDINQALTSQKNHDLILAADVFTYFGELREVLSQCYEALKNRGTIAFSVESTHNDTTYILQTSIRYAHQHQYLKSLLIELKFNNIQIHTVTLRHQYKKPVSGYVIIAQK